MYTILLSIPRSSRHSNPNEVNWESVHSHFSDLFSEDFLCVLKPYKDDHTLAKIFFKKKVVFANRSDDFLINNTVPAKVLERKEETDLPEVSTSTVDLRHQFTDAQLLEIKIDLEEQYGIKLQQCNSSNSEASASLCSLQACHPEVLECAEAALRRWAAEQPVGATAASAVGGAAARQPRRRLFPAAFADGAAAALQQPVPVPPPPPPPADLGGPYDFKLSLNNRCVLRVQPHDITALRCDLLVVTTSCSLSLNYGLARIVAAKAGRQALQQLCRQRISESAGGNLKFGESHLVATPPSSQLPARHLLFLALPNDQRLTDAMDAAQFKAVMREVVARLLDELAQLSESQQGIRSVAMTPLGASLPYWADLSEDFAHVLAACLWGGRGRTGQLARINVCDLQLETLATLGRVLEARFGSASIRQTTQQLQQPQRQPSAAPVAVSADVDAAGGDCDICCSELTPDNPAVPFHCNRGRLCSGCVRRLLDPAAAGNGKCPVCQDRYRPAIGTQPAGGNMTVQAEAVSLPGHAGCATLVVTYTFGPGLQGPDHPNPGQPYRGASRVTYFPDSPRGREIVRRLRAAFDGGAVFTVGTSATTGMENTVTWATVHHKTNTAGGPERHGYPDPTYLQRIDDELSALGY